VKIPSTWKKYKQLRNVFVLLSVNSRPERRVYVLTYKNGKVGLPGGKMLPGDVTPWHAIEDSFSRETGTNLPQKINLLQTFVRGHKNGNQSVVFVAETEPWLKIGPIKTKEVQEGRLRKVSELKRAILDIEKGHSKQPLNLRKLAAKILKTSFKVMGWHTEGLF
jgi:hypothetical protein